VAPPAHPGGMPIDNDMYFRSDLVWWDDSDDSLATFLRQAVNPLRFAYFQRVIAATAPARAGTTLLDVGCGGGFLAEEFAKSGFRVSGVDPSPHLVETARAHAAAGGLDIRYLTGSGEHLPFPDASFDLVACCDVLEHVDAIGPVVAEITRVLKPGGMFLFDTINRTWVSWLFIIKVAQDWKATAWEAPRTHVWSKFVKPEELVAVMAQHGLRNGDLRGMEPSCNPLRALRWARRRAKGLCTRRDLVTQFGLRESSGLGASYMGFAVKTSRAAP
jgi:2-polyprenyl-6-hydroxyphenyl methylase/3-demethylubiquinone-9 3-methyltransferase